MYFEKCSDYQLKEIYDDINVTKDSLERDVKYLMDWLEKQPHLPNVQDIDILTSFLIRCKNNLEKTKRKLDVYYSGKAILTDIFTNRDPSDETFKKIFHSVLMIPIPKLTPEGNRIIYCCVSDPANAQLMTREYYLKMVFMMSEIQLKDDICRKIIHVWDVKNLSLNIATNMVKGTQKVASAVAKDMNPIRMNKVIILNMKPMLVALLEIVKHFLSKKVADAIEVWDKEEDLRKIMPVDLIPSDYGGKGKSLEELKDEFYQYVLTFREWFKLQDGIKGDLSKRTDDLFKEISLHGVDGSFRQLSLD